MKQKDYVFIIGFEGDKALVDKRARARYGSLDVPSLVEKGLFKEACRLSLFDNNKESLAYVLEKFNAHSSAAYQEPEDLIKVFGIQPPSETVKVRII